MLSWLLVRPSNFPTIFYLFFLRGGPAILLQVELTACLFLPEHVKSRFPFYLLRFPYVEPG